MIWLKSACVHNGVPIFLSLIPPKPEYWMQRGRILPNMVFAAHDTTRILYLFLAAHSNQGGFTMPTYQLRTTLLDAIKYVTHHPYPQRPNTAARLGLVLFCRRSFARNIKMVLAPGQASSNVLHTGGWWMVIRTNPLNLVCAAVPTQLPFDKETKFLWRGQSAKQNRTATVVTLRPAIYPSGSVETRTLNWTTTSSSSPSSTSRKSRDIIELLPGKRTSKVTLKELNIRFWFEFTESSEGQFYDSYPYSIPLDGTSEFAAGTVACCVWQVIVELYDGPDSRAIHSFNTIGSVHFKMRVSLLSRMGIPVFIIVVNDQLN